MALRVDPPLVTESPSCQRPTRRSLFCGLTGKSSDMSPLWHTLTDSPTMTASRCARTTVIHESFHSLLAAFWLLHFKGGQLWPSTFDREDGLCTPHTLLYYGRGSFLRYRDGLCLLTLSFALSPSHFRPGGRLVRVSARCAPIPFSCSGCAAVLSAASAERFLLLRPLPPARDC